MNQDWFRHNFAAPSSVRNAGIVPPAYIRTGLTSALGIALVLCPPTAPQAQQQRYKEQAVRVKGIASSGDTVSISADGPLTHAQTFQTPGYFHVLLVNGQSDLGNGSPRGVKVQRVSNSLELLIPIKAGASVTVQPRGNRLDLTVSGGSDRRVEAGEAWSGSAENAATAATARERAERAPQNQSAARNVQEAQKRRGAPDALLGESYPPKKKESSTLPEQVAAGAAPHNNAPVSVPPVAASGAGDNPPVPDSSTAGLSENSVALPVAAQLQTSEEGTVGSFIFSLTTLLLLLGGSLIAGALFILRRRRGASESKEPVEEKANFVEMEEGGPEFAQHKGDRRKTALSVAVERRKDGRGAEDEATRRQKTLGDAATAGNGNHSENRPDAKLPTPALPAVLFGAYRVDQEVGRLVQGQSHSVEVLSSRASDDRRAVETSLLKVLHAPETDEDGRRRVRMALEDYGFVARQSATLLLASDTFERVSSARTLGQVQSPQALPFLTEALYDNDPLVRTEAVQSLGALGLPSAIGALLDTARKHPEIPASILGPALTSCSVECVELAWGTPTESRTFANTQEGDDFTGEICGLESLSAVEQLPEWLEDETLSDALDRLESTDVEVRISAAQSLAQFQVQRAVEALAAMTVRDESAAVRATAVTSLSVIDHESVFAPVLVGMADDAREVRAAAARALSRLSFERADAYVRVIETTDEQMLSDVARACVKAGLAAQAIDRLASEDRRQAYEAFSLLSLVVKAGETKPILEAVEKHRDINVRLASIRLLGLMYQPELLQQLHHIAGHGNVPETVRAAIIEAVQRADETQAQAV